MKVTALYLGKKPVEQLKLTPEGIIGDKERDSKRAIALALHDEKRIQGLYPKGLCTDRYKENVTLEHMEVEEGSEYWLGTAFLRIHTVGKDCFPNCPLDDPCHLTKDVAYGEILMEGEVHVGDTCIKKE